MRIPAFSLIMMSALAAGPVLAQSATPPGTDPSTGARPGNEVGTGMSLPTGTTASNIDGQNTRSTIAPNLPTPPSGANATPIDYLQDAQNMLAAGRTGQAQQALEMAQTRLLDRSVIASNADVASSNPAVLRIRDALHALAAGDRTQSMMMIAQAKQLVGSATP